MRIPEAVLDEYVVMRFAELVDERKVAATMRRASMKWRGNGGAISLLYHGKAIIARIGSLKPDPERLELSKLLKRHPHKQRRAGKLAQRTNLARSVEDRWRLL